MYPNSLAVQKARLASNLFDALQLAWQARIEAKAYQLSQYATGEDVYECGVLKRTVDNFNSVYGSNAVTWDFKKGLFGTSVCRVPYGQLPEDYMRPIVNRVLREGSISPAEIAAKKKANAARVAKIKREQELCALGPWNRYLEENPGMKAWAAANPGPAEAQKKKYLQNPKNQASCSGISSRQIKYDWTNDSVYINPNQPPSGGCNKYGICR